ncbi:MAG: ABC transporter substrate-binding protein [Candidatus Rokubacteria bacterium]|nr:ABC transporter substrate-binding protein [Candidatus Rokubacteria bacterium]
MTGSRSTHRWKLAIAVSLLLLVALGAENGTGAQTPETVTVQLKWHHQTQFAGNYVADKKGFYAKEKLVVENRPWKVGAPSPAEQVVSGAATFGITSHTQFLVDRGRGVPVVAIAAIYQKSPVGFFALKRSGIKHPKDFTGKAVAFAPTHEMHLRAVMKRLGLDFASVRRAPYSFDLTPFYKGEVPVWAGYVMNQPVDARLAGHEVTVIFPDDYGVHTYDDIIFTSEDVIRRNPALVERWLRATLRGWRHAIENPEEACEITLKADPTLKRDKQMAMLLASIPLIHTGQYPIGWMTREVWEEAMEIMLEQKILSRSLAVEKAYTTRFLEQAARR